MVKIKDWYLLKRNKKETAWQNDITGHIITVRTEKKNFWTFRISGKYQDSGSRQKMEDKARNYMKKYIGVTRYPSHAKRMKKEGYNVRYDRKKRSWIIKR